MLLARSVGGAAILVGAALSVVLGFKVKSLEERLETLRDRTSNAYPGYYVPTFNAVTLSGTPVTIGETRSGKQVLFIFRTTCPYCEASLPAWKEVTAIADSFSASPVEVHAVSLDSTEITHQYVRSHDLRMSVLEFPAKKLARLFRVRAVPQFLVLDEEGRVLYSRTGVLDDRAAIDSLLQAFSFTSPSTTP